MKAKLTTGIAAAFLLLGTSVAQADGKAFTAQERSQIRDAWAQAGITVVVTDDDRNDAHPGKGNKQGLNPGMQKRVQQGKGLPPGWQKHLSRGQPVPTDIWAYRQPLPTDVMRRLPPQPDGVLVVRVDNQVLRVASATMVLLDAFDLY